jgi:hypothetical protein
LADSGCLCAHRHHNMHVQGSSCMVCPS